MAEFTEAVLKLQADGFLLPEDALKLIRTAAKRDFWSGAEDNW